MTMTISISKEFAYPLAVAVAYPFVLHWMAFKVVSARGVAKVAYPNLYATEAEAKEDKAKFTFNCTQRGHQNTLENLPSFFILFSVASLKYPIYSAGLGFLYLVGRIFYFRGYASGDPKKRMQGGVQYIGLVGLAGLAITTIANLFYA